MSYPTTTEERAPEVVLRSGRLDSPPVSAASQRVSFWGTVVFVAAVLVQEEMGHAKGLNGLISLLLFIIFLVSAELFGRRVHRRKSSGLHISWERLQSGINLRRVLVKLIGFAVTVSIFLFCYAVFPLYDREFYQPWHYMLARFAPWLILIIIPYVLLIDAWMTDPEDGYYHTGRLALLRWKGCDGKAVREHLLAWLIKGFFLPLMSLYLINAVGSFTEALDGWPARDGHWLSATVVVTAQLALMVDLAFVVTGYMMTCRLTDSHIRSVNPFLWGWLLCLVMYQPFWGLIGKHYLAYNDGTDWTYWFRERGWLFYGWGVSIICTKMLWMWANISFGLRFSNLTLRGIITNGPYRWTKHPSYLFKNISWWLISMPFLSAAGTWQAVQHSFLLLVVNGIYLGRAISEERHLAEDPDYVRYAAWISRHGLFAHIHRRVDSGHNKRLPGP